MNEKYGFISSIKDSILKPDAISSHVINTQGVKSGVYLAKICLLSTFILILAMLILAYPLGGLKKITDTFTEAIPYFELSNGYLTD